MAYHSLYSSGLHRLQPAVAFLLLLSLLLAVSCAGPSAEQTAAADVLVSAEWLESQGDEIVILETGRSSQDFLAEHIPGAVYVIRELYYQTVDGVDGMLPDVETLALDLGDLGVSRDLPVVVYDGGNGLWAARLFWTLEYLGHPNVHLLNGGFAGWKAQGRELSSSSLVPERRTFELAVRDELLADQEYVQERIGADDVTIIDTRSGGEYEGSDVRAARGGHIPGSVHLEWTNNLGSDGGFLSIEQLAGLYAQVLESEDEEALTLCQTGVRGAHSYVALRAAGYRNVRLYDGSWAEWGNDPEAPVEL